MPDECTETIPRPCADAFAGVREALARIEVLAQSTHDQAAKTNGHVEDLFSCTNEHGSRLSRLEAASGNTWRLLTLLIATAAIVVAILR